MTKLDTLKATRKKLVEMHRRAQRAEHLVRRYERILDRERRGRIKMTQIVCLAWEILPSHIRDEITEPLSNPNVRQSRDLVRGIAMLWERGKAALREGVEAAIEQEKMIDSP